MDPIQQIRDAAALLAPVIAGGFQTLSDEDLCLTAIELEGLGRLVDAGRVVVAAEVDDRSRYELGVESMSVRLGGQKKPIHFLETLTRASQPEMARRVKLGRAIRPRTGLLGDVLPAPFEHVAAAVTAGRIGVDAAAAIVRDLDLSTRHRADPTDVVVAEEALVEVATMEPADIVRVEASVWRVALDPDGVAPREDAIRERRSARLGREFNGITTLTVSCDQELAATLRTVFLKATQPGTDPVFLSESERLLGAIENSATENGATEDGELIDPRSREQIQHDTLSGLINAGLKSTGKNPGELKPLTAVVATVHLKDLLEGIGAGWITGVNEPVSMDTIQQFICDAGFRKLVLGVNDEPLFLGKTERLFTAAQRKARAAIDGGCVWDNCDCPPEQTQMHHADEVVADNGNTDIDNGVLLCPAAHRLVHQAGYKIRLVNSKPYLLAPPHLDPTQTWKPMNRSRHMKLIELKRQLANKKAG